MAGKPSLLMAKLLVCRDVYDALHRGADRVVLTPGYGELRQALGANTNDLTALLHWFSFAFPDLKFDITVTPRGEVILVASPASPSPAL